MRASAALALGLWLAPAAGAQSVLIRGARIVTVSGPVIAEGSVLVRDGRIAQVGGSVSAPADAQVIDARGLTLYPGLFDASSGAGMQTARETTMGELLPHLRAFWSFHFDADLVELSRANGVTHIVARPGRTGPGGRLRRGLIPGQAAVMNLSGDGLEKSEITRDGPLVVNFPSVGELEYTGDERFAVEAWSKTRKAYERALGDLKRFFKDARDYAAAKPAVPDLVLEAMTPVVRGERLVYLVADNAVDIQAAVAFGKAERLRFAIEGGAEAWKLLDVLATEGVRVVLGSRQGVPDGEDDPVDILYRTPELLRARGVTFVLTTAGGGGAVDSRHLAYQAGNAVAYGLPYDAALRAITLTPAELLGLASELGSIEKGKRANLVLAEGDLLEPSTKIRGVWIDGRPVSIETIQTRNYEKYRAKP